MKPADRDAAHLHDMREAALEARELVADMEAPAFLRDRVRRRALERLLGVIGESALRITPERRATHPEIWWRRLIGLRNILVREYGRINPRVLYQTAREDMPSLIAGLERILPRP